MLANTKGGVGKTVIATQVIPTLFIGQNKNIFIHELDNSNTTKFTNSKINFSNVKADAAEDKIIDLSFDTLSNDEEIHIIDAGGGDDTLKVLTQIKQFELANIKYIIPINDDIDQVQNAKDTINEIRKIEQDADITLILNRANEDYKDKFIGLFGSEKYGIDSNTDAPEFKGINIARIEETSIFTILKNIQNMTLFDIYEPAKEVLELDYAEAKTKWIKEGKETFKKKMKFRTFAKDCIDLSKKINDRLEHLKG